MGPGGVQDGVGGIRAGPRSETPGDGASDSRHCRDNMAWIILFVAGLFEVCWAVCLQESKGFTRPWPTVGFGVSMLVSLFLLGVALKTLPLGTAYTVWTGVGAVGTVLLGITLLGESADLPRLACIGLIVLGIVGLKLATPH